MGAKKSHTDTSWYWKEIEREKEEGRGEKERETEALIESHRHSMKSFMSKTSFYKSRLGPGAE